MNERVNVKDTASTENLAIVQLGDKEPQVSYIKSSSPGSGMTYRLVHITSTSGGSGEVVTSDVISPAAAGGTAHGTLQLNAVPRTAAVDEQMAYIQTSGSTDSLAALSTTGTGGFYVISPQEIGVAGGGGGGGSRLGGRQEPPRDDRRRATHNEVERRRRDKINSWITKLGKLLPEAGDLSKQNQSKGAVLAQACDYIQDTRTMQLKYMELIRENEKLTEDVKMLKQSNEALVTANQLLKAHLKSQGAVILEGSDSSGQH